MAGSTFGRWSLLLGAALAVSACQDGARRNADVVGAAPAFAQAGVRVNRTDVEAPEVFEKTETGLWDGRPSLGGVWVAHPDVTTPERVSIVNLANGKSIVGALFRRERANPGPRIQISSDAAAELGILAGQPTMLRVVALKRREELRDVPAAAEAPAAGATDGAPGGATDGATGGAAAATAAAGPTTAAAAPTEAAVGADAAAEPQPVPEDRPPTSFARRRQAAAAAPAPQPSDASLAEPQPVVEDTPPTSFGRRRARSEGSAEAAVAPAEAGDISVAPLDGAAPAPAAAIRFPYIQAAAFSSESNANAAAERLRGAGMTAEVRKAGSLWRVLAGPVGSASEQASLLARVKALGYSDAYPVRN